MENSLELNVLNAKGNILKKINILFIINFCLGKYSFSFDTFWINLIYFMSISIVLN